MMKKLLIPLLALALALTLTACGGRESAPAGTVTATATPTAQPENAAEAPTASDAPSEAPAAEASEAPASDVAEAPADEAVEEPAADQNDNPPEEVEYPADEAAGDIPEETSDPAEEMPEETVDEPVEAPGAPMDEENAETVGEADTADSDAAEQAPDVAGEIAGLPNPWADSDADAITLLLNGAAFSLPAGAENVIYRDNADMGMAEAQFDIGEVRLVARARKTAEFEDISGLHYDHWDLEEPCAIGASAGTRRRVADGDKTIDVCLWRDADSGVTYAVAAQSAGPEGFDILAVAEQICAPQAGA